MIDRLARSRFARLPLVGFAVPCVIFLQLWQSNAHRLGYEDALPTGIALSAVVLVALAALRWLAGSWVCAGMMLGILCVYTFYAPALTRLLASPLLEAGVLALGAVIAIDLARRIPSHDPKLERVNALINLVAVAIVLILAGRVIGNQYRLETMRPETANLFPAFPGRADRDAPDVWHIVMDRYGNRETLARVYDYDNGPFLEALRDRGFAVRDDANANYQRTAHSLASTLNASYLEPLAEGRQFGGDWVPVYRAMRDNRAMQFFAEAGYTTLFAGTWWNPSRRSAEADENVNMRDLPELARLLVEQSVPGRILQLTGLPYGDSRTDQCLRERFKFGALREAASRDERKYVFAHFLVPHPPYVINADGTCRTLAEAESASRRDNYVGQLDYANRELLALIDAILAGPRPASIILQADEGPWPAPHFDDERFIGRDPVDLDWATLARPELREKVGILFAIRHADNADTNIPASPINIYPAILRQSFGARMADRPDRHLIFHSRRELYRFSDIEKALN